MAFYTYDHIHLLSPEPMETAQYFNQMFGARIVESVQSDGNPRVGPGPERAGHLHRPLR